MILNSFSLSILLQWCSMLRVALITLIYLCSVRLIQTGCNRSEQCATSRFSMDCARLSPTGLVRRIGLRHALSKVSYLRSNDLVGTVCPTFYSLKINILTSCFLFLRSHRARMSAWTLIARLSDHPWLIISSCWDWLASRNS